MRVVLLVAVAVALFASSAVTGRRIHKMKAALTAADEADADVEAQGMPFEGNYWDLLKPEYTKTLAAEAKKAQLSTADLLTQFFKPENILLAQQQQANVVATIGTYSATEALKSCNEGVCDDKWTEKVITGDLARGGAGNIVLTCTVPAAAAPAPAGTVDTKTATCQVDFQYTGGTFFTCTNIGGGAAKKCGNPRPQRWSTGAGTWMSDDVLIKTDALPGSAIADVYVTKEQITANYKFYGNDSNRKLVFTALFVQSSNLKAYVPVVSPAVPADAAELVAARKAAKLTTAQILKKFFSPDNIQLAQMQGSTVPVRATIASYSAAANTRTCNTGVCTAYAPYPMTGDLFAGGEGSIVLTCTVPQDLTKAVCQLDAYYGASKNSLFSCPDIGGASPKCGNPRPQRWSTGAGTWMSNDFITTVTEAAEAFFTNDQFVVHFRYRGNNSNRQLVFADFTLTSTALTEFGIPPKTNCLSKTTADAVIAAAAANKGLKNKIVLQAGPVAELIKAAPYKTVEDAVAKIKGIGPKNVVYVSFMWNFSC